MPQTVNAYIETNDLSQVDRVKRDIISLYEEDFRKFDPMGALSTLFDSIPAQLMENASRYQVSGILEKQKGRQRS